MDIKRILLQLCFIGALAIGCDSSSEPGSDNTGGTEVPPSVKPSDTTSTPDTPIVVDLDTCELTKYSVLVDCMGGEEVIVVKSNRSYDVTPDVSWITVKESGRAVVATEVTIEIAENSDATERKGVVSFVMKDTKEPLTLKFEVTQTAVGVVFEEKKSLIGIDDMHENIWHPTVSVQDLVNHVNYITSFSGDGAQYDDVDFEIDLSFAQNFFRLDMDLKEAIEQGVVTRELISYYDDGYRFETSSVKNPMVPEGAYYGAMYKSTGVVLPSTSTFDPAYSMIISEDGVATIEILKRPTSRTDYNAGFYLVYVNDLGDTYRCGYHFSVGFFYGIQ